MTRASLAPRILLSALLAALLACGDDVGSSSSDGSAGTSAHDGDDAGAPAVILYASPDGGGGACSRAAPCSLEGAQEAARRATAGGVNGDVVVDLLDGTYALSTTWTLSPDKGDSGSNGFYVVYQADGYGTAAAAKPVVTGGRRLTGFALHDAANHVWRADVGDLDTRQLYVDGRRATRARQPTSVIGPLTQTASGYVTSNAAIRSWPNPADAELVFHDGDGLGNWLWAEPRCPIASVGGDASSTTITVAQPCFDLVLAARGGHLALPTAVENAAALLAAPGTFYIDRSVVGHHVLDYVPRSGEDMTTAEVVAPVLERLVSGEGTLSSPLHHVAFEGITFAYATWMGPSEPHGFPETSYNKMNNAGAPETQSLGNVTFYAGQHLRFEGDTFTHLGGAGLSLDDGSRFDTVVGSVFTDISGNGIQIGNVDPIASSDAGLSTDNVVANDYVHDIGVEFPGAYGVWNANTQRTTVAHNTFAHLPRGAIASNYTYAGPPGVASGHRFVDNLVYDYLNAVRDGGGFDTNGAQNGVDGNQPDSLLSGNVFRDDHNNYGQIYLDFWTSGLTLVNNVAYSSKSLDYNTIDAQHQPCCNPQRYNFYDQDNRFKYQVAQDMVVGDAVLPPAAMPASILQNAGLEPAYRYLAPATPPADTQPPSAPSAAHAGSIAPGASVTVSWSPSSDDTGVTGYEVDSGDLVVAAVDGRATSATVVGLEPGSTYHLLVRARDAAANLSPPSQEVTVVVPGDHDLVGHWTFDEGTGASARDDSGAQNDGAISAGAAFVAGAKGAALELDGASGTVTVGNAQLLNEDRGSFSVALWFRSTATTWARLVTKGNWGDTSGYFVQYNRGGVTFGVGSNGVAANSTIANTPLTFGDGRWHHVGAVVDRAARTLVVYVDGLAQPLTVSPGFCGKAVGTAVSFDGCPYPAASSNDPFTMGSYGGVAEFFAGAIDDVRLYRRALSAADVEALRN